MQVYSNHSLFAISQHLYVFLCISLNLPYLQTITHHLHPVTCMTIYIHVASNYNNNLLTYLSYHVTIIFNAYLTLILKTHQKICSVCAFPQFQFYLTYHLSRSLSLPSQINKCLPSARYCDVHRLANVSPIFTFRILIKRYKSESLCCGCILVVITATGAAS